MAAPIYGRRTPSEAQLPENENAQSHTTPTCQGMGLPKVGTEAAPRATPADHQPEHRGAPVPSVDRFRMAAPTLSCSRSWRMVCYNSLVSFWQASRCPQQGKPRHASHTLEAVTLDRGTGENTKEAKALTNRQNCHARQQPVPTTTAPMRVLGF